MPRLTEKMITALAPPAGKREAWLSDTEVPGLRVRATGDARTFYAAWTDRATGERRRERLGAFGAITLDQARSAARVILGDVAKGDDPKAKREAQREAAEERRRTNALTLAGLVSDWSALHLAQRRPRYRAEAVRAIEYGFTKHLKLPAAKLSRAEVVEALDAMAKAGHVAMAGRTKAYGAACFAWAVKRGRLAANPFHAIPIAAGVVERERALSDAELGRIWTATGQMAAPFGPLLRVLLLTLVRREEAAGMRWSELSPDCSTWTISGARMKRGLPHVVALSDPARAILRSVPRIDGQDLVFSSTGSTPPSGFSKAKAALDKAAKVEGWRLHDFRRTGVSVLARLGFNPIVADRLLAHQPSTLRGAAKIYQVHDFAEERARALAAWAQHVLRCADGGEAGGNVVAIAAGRRGGARG